MADASFGATRLFRISIKYCSKSIIQYPIGLILRKCEYDNHNMWRLMAICKWILMGLVCLSCSCARFYSGNTEIIVTSSCRGLTGAYTEYRVPLHELIKKNVKTNIWVIVIYDRYEGID